MKATIPEKPFTGASVIVELAVTPAYVRKLVGFVDMVKSVTWKRIDAVTCDSEPMVPVTITV